MAAALLATVATSCSGEDPRTQPPTPSESTTPSSVTTSPTETTSPTPSDTATAIATPRKPPATGRRTQAGAVAFAHYYIEVLNYTSRSGDTSLVKSASDEACESCNSIIDVTERVYEQGGYIRNSKWKVLSHSSFRDGGGWRLSLEIKAAPQRVKPSEAEPVETREGGRYVMSMRVRQMQDAWQVTSLERVA